MHALLVFDIISLTKSNVEFNQVQLEPLVISKYQVRYA